MPELVTHELMARLKYDSYRGYFAGARFIESLLDWLQQFDEHERETAYQFVRKELVYVGPTELHHLIELFYPETVRRVLSQHVASQLGLPSYLVWSRPDAKAAYARLLRETLFMGISDGARVDAFRRANVGVISNEQVVPSIEIDDARWDSLLKDLRKDTGDSGAMFRFVFLVDDFMGSGLTLLRLEDVSEGKKEWGGKLKRFWKAVKPKLGLYVVPDFKLVVHYYISSANAASTIEARAAEAAAAQGSEWFSAVTFEFGTKLPATLPITREGGSSMLPVIDAHYNPSIMTPSLRVGGDDARLGFAKSGLPLVLEHNAPNNGIALLWAEAPPTAVHPEMRPLFRRRQRHL